MGFDVYGYKNKTYFRNNVWSWYPLWSYVCYHSKDVLTENDMSCGQHNMGHHISEKKTKKIIKILEGELNTGRTEKCSKSFRHYCENLPDEKCFICDGKGKNPIDITEENPHGLTDKCTLCKGTGKSRPSITFDEFSTDNIDDFLEFLKKTEGGFIIC